MNSLIVPELGYSVSSSFYRYLESFHIIISQPNSITKVYGAFLGEPADSLELVLKEQGLSYV